ncbi:DUF397 domain-containing protein [Streptomyces umbrinus]|uniref:DUF397 domain-containing protein n=1 Tax=Streptomyces umbrinus TaxID=67370 RepID=UPI003C2EE7D3
MLATIPNWRTSSYTGTESCVEVADNDPNKVMIRDTKTRTGGTVAIPRSAWTYFVEYAKKG